MNCTQKKIDRFSTRLPKYQKTLRALLSKDVSRVSSAELAEAVGLTPSQVRRDVAAVGEKGLRGYGYSVRSLYGSICACLGLGDAYSAVIVGDGNPAKILSSEPLLFRFGVAFRGVLPAKNIGEILTFCRKNCPDILILLASVVGKDDLPHLAKTGVKGILNLSGRELPESGGILVENLIPSDSLMLLCRRLNTQSGKEMKKETKQNET